MPRCGERLLGTFDLAVRQRLSYTCESNHPLIAAVMCLDDDQRECADLRTGVNVPIDKNVPIVNGAPLKVVNVISPAAGCTSGIPNP